VQLARSARIARTFKRFAVRRRREIGHYRPAITRITSAQIFRYIHVQHATAWKARISKHATSRQTENNSSEKFRISKLFLSIVAKKIACQKERRNICRINGREFRSFLSQRNCLQGESRQSPATKGTRFLRFSTLARALCSKGRGVEERREKGREHSRVASAQTTARATRARRGASIAARRWHAPGPTCVSYTTVPRR